MWENAALPFRPLSLILLVAQRPLRPLSLTVTASIVDPSAMGRTSTKSVARVYADVNGKLGPSWHEYGAVSTPLIDSSFLPLISPSKIICRSSGDLKTTTRLFGK